MRQDLISGVIASLARCNTDTAERFHQYVIDDEFDRSKSETEQLEYLVTLFTTKMANHPVSVTTDLCELRVGIDRWLANFDAKLAITVVHLELF